MTNNTSPNPAPCSSEKLHLQLWGKSRGLTTYYPLLAHLLDTAATAESIIDVMLPSSLAETVTTSANAQLGQWKQTVKTLAGWHDVGKASCSFQNFDPQACPKWLLNRTDAESAGRHDSIGAYLIWDKLTKHQSQSRYRLAQIISGHHGKIQKPNKNYLHHFGGAALVDNNPPQKLLQARETLWETLDHQIGITPDLYLPTVSASVTLAIVILADWIASDLRFVAAQQDAIDADSGLISPKHMERANELARQHLVDYGLTSPAAHRTPTPNTMFGPSTIQHEHESSSPAWTHLQESINSEFAPTGSGIIVICAPTGEGKTEAALIAANKLGKATGRHGLYFAMPTVATAEGLYDRIESHVTKTAPDRTSSPVRRVHSQSILHEDIGADPVSDDPKTVRTSVQWMRGTRKTMLSPFGVGTIDQVLLGALKAKYSPLRILGTSLGCLVVDEAHALDPYMRRLLIRAVEWLAALGTPVVVLSATMPSKRVAELMSAYQKGAKDGDNENIAHPFDGYPMWVGWTAEDGWSGASMDPRDRWEVRFDTEKVSNAELTHQMAEAAVNTANKQNCVLLVRSTVRKAQETYNVIRSLDPSLAPGDTVEIIHSRMPYGIRRQRSDRLLVRFGPDPTNRPKKMILVATQVVEQSFDVDFDVLITDPAPVSALLQRAGRIRRHRRSSLDDTPVPVIVMWPMTSAGEPHKGSAIYPKADLMASWTCLTSDGPSLTVQIPEQVPDLVERADIEGEKQFEFDDSLVEEAEEATLAQLVRTDQDMSEAENWAIPHPWEHDKPLDQLTGSFDTDETHPGTRHKAASVLLLPGKSSEDGWMLKNETLITPNPDKSPKAADIRAAFDAAIPVSYPASEWVEALEQEQKQLGRKWDRTPVGRTLLCDMSTGPEVNAGGYRLHVCDEVGLVITRKK